MGTQVSAAPPGTSAIPSAKSRSRSDLFLGRDWKIGWLFVLPLTVIMLALVAYPFVSGIILSFQRKAVGEEATWIGLQNYVDLLAGDQYSSTFWKSVWVSLQYTAISVAFKFLLGLAMALVLNERFPGRTLARTILFIPWAMPTIIVALTWRWILDGSFTGLVNYIRVEYFDATTLVQFLASPDIALWSVILVVVWQGTPFYTMMFLAGLQTIPREYYEAAQLDGANVLRRFWDITLPSLYPAIIVTTLLSTIWTANSINFIFVLTRGGPANATMTFPMLAYEIGMSGARQLGLAAAVSVLFFPLFIVVISILTRRMLSQEARI